MLKSKRFWKYFFIGLGIYSFFAIGLFCFANVPLLYDAWNDYCYPNIVQNNNLKIQNNDYEIRLQLNEPYENFGERWFVSPSGNSEEVVDLNNCFVNLNGNYRVYTFDCGDVIECKYIKPKFLDSEGIDKRYSHYKFVVVDGKVVQV